MICLIALVDLVSFGLVIGVVPIYLSGKPDSGMLVGLVMGSYALAQFLFLPVLGRWSDRWGRRPILLLSISGSVVGHVLLAIAFAQHSIPMMFISRILDGITGANIATAQAYIADITTGNERARGLGIFGAMIGLGFILGPLMGIGLMHLGAMITGQAINAWPAIGAAIFSTTAGLLIWRLLPEPPRHESAQRDLGSTWSALRRVSRHDRVRELLLLLTTMTFAFIFLEQSFVLLLMQRFKASETWALMILAYMGFLMVLVRGGLVGRLVRKYREPYLAGVAPFLVAAGMLSIALTEFWPLTVLFLLACVPIAVGRGLAEPVLQGLLSRQSSATDQGIVLGVASSLASLCRVIAFPLSGRIYSHHLSAPYYLAGSICLLAGFFALIIRGRQMAAIEQSGTGQVTRLNPESA
ncbi:MAG: Tetracycline resistance protein, class C [Phycisphaerae bacterium]|nr:Tetracycline resistance protein, class C [Phycisphaerae bacterium]